MKLRAVHRIGEGKTKWKNQVKRLLVASMVVLMATAAQAADQFTMKITTPTIGDINVEWMNLFKKGVEARSNGRIKVELYPASQLGSMASTIDGTMLGTIEAAFVASGFLVGIEPRYQLFDAVGIFDDIHHGQLVFNDPEVRKRMATFGNAKGVEPLTTFVHSDNVLVVKKPVTTLAEIKGLKVRTYSTPMQIEAVKKLGASPIPMSLGEVLPAIQNGTIDGAITGNTILTAFKYYDAAKYAVYLPSFSTVAGAIVNKAWLDLRLPTCAPSLPKRCARQTPPRRFGVPRTSSEQKKSGRRMAASTRSCRRQSKSASSTT